MTDNSPIAFRKMNGLGNEIVMVDLRGSSKVFNPREAANVAALPNSHFDQMMVLHDPRSPGTDAFVRIYNSDGSLAGACGNGTRCIAWIIAKETGRRELAFETEGGILNTTVQSIDHISVDMGRPRLKWHEIPLAEEFADTTRIELQVGPIDNPVLHSPSVVNVGNPHAIFWVHDVSSYDLARLGPLLENHPVFPEGANISLAQLTSRNAIILRTWERGSGETRACGSAACAATVAAARKGMSEREIAVNLPGGPLQIEWRADDHIIMTGPAEFEYEGVIDPAALQG